MDECFIELLQIDQLEGCYLNGNLIKSSKQKLELKQKLLEDYINYESIQYNFVIDSIEEQVSKFRK